MNKIIDVDIDRGCYQSDQHKVDTKKRKKKESIEGSLTVPVNVFISNTFISNARLNFVSENIEN